MNAVDRVAGMQDMDGWCESGRAAREVRSAFARSGARIDSADPRQMRFEHRNGRLVEGWAELEGDWLGLTVPLDGALAPVSDLDVLRLARELGGGVRIARPRATKAHALLADVPLTLGADRWLAVLLDQVPAALHRAHANTSLDDAPAVSSENAAPDYAPDLDGLLHVLADTEWVSMRTPGDVVEVNLDSDDVSLEARVTDEPDGIWVRGTLATSPPCGVVGRAAAARLLLEVAASVRLARPICGPEPERTFGWEIWLPAPATPRALDLALGAMSAAFEASHREVACLADELAARAFLAARGVDVWGDEVQAAEDVEE